MPLKWLRQNFWGSTPSFCGSFQPPPSNSKRDLNNGSNILKPNSSHLEIILLFKALWWENLPLKRLHIRYIRYHVAQIQSVQLLKLCPTLFDPMDCRMPAFLVHYQLQELAQIHVHQVGDAIQLSHPLSSPSPPAFNLAQHQGLFQSVSSPHQLAKVLEFQLHICPSNEYLGLISFRIDWLDLLAVQETLKSLFQHHSSKASILQRSAFFIVQLSHPYVTTGETIALTRWTLICCLVWS